MRLTSLDAVREAAIRATAAYFCTLSDSIHLPEIRLDLQGRAAGQWRMAGSRETLRFNMEAFVKDWATHFPATVAHEIAHSVVFQKNPSRRIRPHGPEWRATMRVLGFAPKVTHATPLTGRRSRVYIYRCECRTHHLGPQRHAHARRGRYRYLCNGCGGTLRFAGSSEWHDAVPPDSP